MASGTGGIAKGEGRSVAEASGRDQRRAAALRANLKRRKAQARGRAEAVAPLPDDETPPPSESAAAGATIREA